MCRSAKNLYNTASGSQHDIFSHPKEWRCQGVSPMSQFEFFNAGYIGTEVNLIMANRDRSVNSGSNPSTGGLRGGFANTRPMVLYVGTAVAVAWDIVTFVHLFHFSLSGVSVSFWWPWVWLLLATILLGWSNWHGRMTPWWAWALLGIGVFAVAATTEGTALSIWGALILAVWPRHGHPWWSGPRGSSDISARGSNWRSAA